jgi:hypothetical protein
LPALEPKRSPAVADPSAVTEVAQMAGFLLHRLHLPLDNTCLTRSLTLYHCLRA